jgi:hypothetical protein
MVTTKAAPIRTALVAVLVMTLAALAAWAWIAREGPDESNAETESERSATVAVGWQDDPVVNGWEIRGQPRWIPLKNNFHAAGFYATNRGDPVTSPRRRSLQLDFGLAADYANAPGTFLSASCEAVHVIGKAPTNRTELFTAMDRTTRTGLEIPRGATTYVACVQLAGRIPPEPKRGTRLRIDSSTARFILY